MQMPMTMAQEPSGWQFMQDGLFRLVVNHQGGPRGGDDVTAPNWWMGMATRKVGAGRLTFTGMFSLDPATVGTDGYREIFQVGEALHGVPLVDRQHPHDFFMQLAAVWRVPLTAATGLTIAGGPAGEPALGPVAFMHRASAAETPLAPLSHHTFDSTHIAFGVVTAAVDHGPWTVEASVFNGREPDEHRWNFDFGALDSVSARVWYRPTAEWEFQVSTGHLVHPEQLEPGNIERTTASASWFRKRGERLHGGDGRLRRERDERRESPRGLRRDHPPRRARTRSSRASKSCRWKRRCCWPTRCPRRPHAAALVDTVGAFTFGGVREVGRWRGFEGGVGAALTLYAVPEALQVDARRASGVVPAVLPPAPARRTDGADVEHAHGRTRWPATDGDGSSDGLKRAQRFVIDICPWPNGPVHVFEPEYDPCIWSITSSMSNVPVAVAVHVPVIMLPLGMVMVKVAVLPLMVPDTFIWPAAMPIPPYPGNCIVPVNELPV